MVLSIDNRYDNRRFRLSAHNCQVPTPTSQNLELEQKIRIFGATNSSIAWKIEIHNSWSADLFTKKDEFWEFGVGDWQSMQDIFFEFADEQVLGEG